MSKRKQFISQNGVNYANHERVAIGGKIFEIAGCINSEKFQEAVHRCVNLPMLDECYNKPSQAKINIYDEWNEFRYKNCGLCGACGVASFNTMCFTLDFIISNGFDNFYAHITPAHNYLYVFGKEV